MWLADVDAEQYCEGLLSQARGFERMDAPSARQFGGYTVVAVPLVLITRSRRIMGAFAIGRWAPRWGLPSDLQRSRETRTPSR